MTVSQRVLEEEIAWEREEETPDDWMRFRLNRDLEDLIFKVGLESEREAFLQIQEYRIFYPENETGDVLIILIFNCDESRYEYRVLPCLNINLLFSVEPAPYLPEPARIDQLREVSREQDRIQALCGEYLASQRY